MTEPVFGLRWIPDGSLRPLRYLPSPQQRAAAEGPGGSAMGPPSHDPPPAPSPLQQTQHLRLLTQRLADAEESVRQRSEQIRWLKEMTKDDARRARVSRWMSGPLLRVFAAWKRCVRESVRATHSALQQELSEGAARQREVQARCDEMMREQLVLRAVLEHFFDSTLQRRNTAALAAALRRWGLQRTRLRRRLPFRERRAFGRLCVAVALQRWERRLRRSATTRAARTRVRAGLRAWTRLLAARQDGARVARLSRDWPLRAALRRLRRGARRAALLQRACSLLAPRPARRALRVAWGAWSRVLILRLSAQREAEATRAAQATSELSRARAAQSSAAAEASRLRAVTSLWGEDELPAMLQALATTVEAAEASGADGAAAGAGASVAWQGTQLRLCAAALDSLKRELARERATASSAREEARRSDSVAEQALTMMQQLREEGAQLEARLSAAEAQGLRAQQQLRQREAELYGARRAQQGSARDIARAVAQFEGSCMQRLQQIEGSLEQRAQAVGGAQQRVAVAMQRRRDTQLEQWAKTLV